MHQHMKRFLSYISLASLLVSGPGCSRENSFQTEMAPVEIRLTHLAGGSTLTLEQPVTNPHGEPITVTGFAYYLSNFALVDAADRTITLAQEYFLVNEKNQDSKTIRFFAPEGSYKAIKLLIGVDSARNVSGVQSGALDPANGMFWSWNTGYIFAKLEGKSAVSTAPLQNVTYHIGGFKKAESSLQIIRLDFPQPLEVKKAKNPSIALSAELNKWFSGKHNIKISESAFCMNPGELATRISENYAAMFTVTAVSN